MQKRLSRPSIERLCLVSRALEELKDRGVKTVYSSDLGTIVGESAHNIRKDISMLGEVGNTLAGYDVDKLENHIFSNLGLTGQTNTCIVGLGRLGSAIVDYPLLSSGAFRIVAGFDTDINKLELLKVPIDVFPAYRIEEIVSSRNVSIAIIATPGNAAQSIADRLIGCGVHGIVNFAPVVVTTKTKGVYVRNIDLMNQLRILSALISLESGEIGKSVNAE